MAGMLLIFGFLLFMLLVARRDARRFAPDPAGYGPFSREELDEMRSESH